MPGQRQDKFNTELRKQAAHFFAETSNRQSLITVTRASVAPDLKHATIYITVLPIDQEELVVAFARRRNRDLKAYIGKKMNMRSIPRIEVEIDSGEKNRQRIDEISQEIN